MFRFKVIMPLLVIMMMLIGAGCSKKEDKNTIVFVTDRTDLIDTTMKDYVARFEKQHPEYHVKIEAIGDDYIGILRNRMNTDSYGDVLLVPGALSVKNYPDFLEPLGKVEELAKKYNFVECNSIGGQVYSIPVNVSVTGGIVYDMAVFREAGIKDIPKDPEELEAALKAIKLKTDATPLFTNFRSPWLLAMWQSALTAMSGDGNYMNSLIHKDKPLEEGTLQYEFYKTLYDISASNLFEKDPLTYTWGEALGLFSQGKLGAAVVGLDMYGDVQKNALNKKDIVYMPFKSRTDGGLNLLVQPAYSYAVSVKSRNKEAARAWLDFLIDESGYPDSIGGSWVLKKNPVPEFVTNIMNNGGAFVTPGPVPTEELSIFRALESEAGIGLSGGILENRIMDAAMTGNKTYEDICKEINTKWTEARKKLGVK